MRKQDIEDRLRSIEARLDALEGSRLDAHKALGRHMEETSKRLADIESHNARFSREPEVVPDTSDLDVPFNLGPW